MITFIKGLSKSQRRIKRKAQKIERYKLRFIGEIEEGKLRGRAFDANHFWLLYFHRKFYGIGTVYTSEGPGHR